MSKLFSSSSPEPKALVTPCTSGPPAYPNMSCRGERSKEPPRGGGSTDQPSTSVTPIPTGKSANLADSIIDSVDGWAEIVESYQTGRSCIDAIKLLPHVKESIRTLPAGPHTPAPLLFCLESNGWLSPLPILILIFI